MAKTQGRPATRQRPPAAPGMLDRQLPHDPEAELGVLGSVLLKPDVCDDIATIVRAEDFYDEAHRKLYAHMQDMHSAGKRIDITLLVNRLKKAGDYEAIGGPPIWAGSARPSRMRRTRRIMPRSCARRGHTGR